MNMLFANVRYAAEVEPRVCGSVWAKLLSFRKRKSRVCMKICGGTTPANELKRMSRKDRLVMDRIAVGNVPTRLLLLKSSSKRYRRLAIFGEIVPVKLLEFAWKIAKSGSWSRKPSRVGAERPKPLKSIEAMTVAVSLSGGVPQ